MTHDSMKIKQQESSAARILERPCAQGSGGQEDQTDPAEKSGLTAQADSGDDKSCTGSERSESLPGQMEISGMTWDEMRQFVREILNEELVASQKSSKGEASDQETSAQENSDLEVSEQENSDQKISGQEEQPDEPLVLLKHGKPTRFEQIPQSLREIVVEIFACILIAIGIYSFAKHANLAPGGVVGLALIVNHLLPFIPIGFASILINIPLIAISWKILGRPFLFRTFRTICISAFFMDIVLPRFPYFQGDPILAGAFSGVFTGIGLGLLFSAGTCSGGSDLILMCMRKLKPHMSFGQISLVVDGIIILTGGLVRGDMNAALYGCVYAFFVSNMLDKVMSGRVSGKLVLVISEHAGPISHGIDTEIVRGATILNGRGSYTKRHKEIILCAMSKRQLPHLRRLVRSNDPGALVIVLDFNEVYGTGFQDIMNL
ncbi:MAG: YitT family protein [Clostridiales bacterium]|nr:YitT family protein [Clostridiales bacterium]MDD7433285.1 YitT family protein [Clostridiales bacterium]MDY3062017.1 YitT family protein [Eubacteriales bacterium]